MYVYLRNMNGNVLLDVRDEIYSLKMWIKAFWNYFMKNPTSIENSLNEEIDSWPM